MSTGTALDLRAYLLLLQSLSIVGNGTVCVCVCVCVCVHVHECLAVRLSVHVLEKEKL